MSTVNPTPPRFAGAESLVSDTPSLRSQPVAAPSLPGAALPGDPQADLAALVRGLLASAIGEAAARQDSLAPLFADLERLLSRPAPDMPQAVREAAAALFALRLDAEGASAAQVKAAFAAAGLFSVGARASGESAPPDLVAALQRLRTALVAWRGAQAANGAPNPAPIPPPHRDAAPLPQAPVAATIGAGMTAGEMAGHLLQRTEAALARQTLLQLVSLSDDGAETTPRNAPAARLAFESPLASAQGTAVIPLHIAQDDAEQGRREAAEGQKPIMRASFALDIEPIGRVHARIALAGRAATVTLFAEREASARALRAHLPQLEGVLREAALEPLLDCRTGAPQLRAAATPGLFLDRAT
jgi:hypothetical protein